MSPSNNVPKKSAARAFAALRAGALFGGVLVLATGCVPVAGGYGEYDTGTVYGAPTYAAPVYGSPGYYAPGYGYGGGVTVYGGGGGYRGPDYRDRPHEYRGRPNDDRGRPGGYVAQPRPSFNGGHPGGGRPSVAPERPARGGTPFRPTEDQREHGGGR